MAFVIPVAYAVPMAISGVSTLGGFAMGYYYGTPYETPINEKKEQSKSLSDELASFDITKLKRVPVVCKEMTKEKVYKEMDGLYSELKTFHTDLGIKSLKKVSHEPKKLVELEHKLTKLNKELKEFHTKKYLPPIILPPPRKHNGKSC